MLGAAVGALALASGTAWAEERAAISIDAQPLTSALYEYGTKTGRQILFSPDIVPPSARSTPVSGEADEEVALRQLLAGTGLTFSRRVNMFVIQEEGGGAPQGESAAGGGAEVEALVVTAQKREEQIQDVPIAISAFTQKSLEAQKIEGGFDLLKAIPNVTFSKTNFTGYNFSIRGIGTKAVSATTDPGVAVAFNNSGLIVNRLFEQEYFDVERVEVLRGPQGTLYGRNATSGVINVISAKPRLGEFLADVKLETGNYNAQRIRAMVNVPVGDAIAVRGAFAATKRDGYGTNLIDGSDVDNRNLWSSRLTVGFEPNEAVRGSLLWEHFEENDERVRTSKQLCHRDPGLTEVLGVPFAFDYFRNVTSQGCLPGSLYEDAAFGKTLGDSLPFIAGGDLSAVYPGDVFGEGLQSRDLRAIESTIQPKYRAKSDIFDLSVHFDLTDALTLSSQTLYTQDEVYSTQDLNRVRSQPIFPDTLTDPLFNYRPDLAALAPNGIFCDPQLGCSNTMVAQDVSQSASTQFNQEFGLASDFDGPVNFSLGGNYTYFETENDYYVFINVLTWVQRYLFKESIGVSDCLSLQRYCQYEDPNPLESVNGDGHNYFRSRNPYRLTSSAVFGELYWEATPTLKVTLGARMTWDRKVFTPVPSQTLLADYREVTGPSQPPEACTTSGVYILCQLKGTGVGGRGYPAEPDIVQEWAEPTGRLILDWKPDLTFTDETMVYASYARGYKGGGANPPTLAKPARLFNEKGRNAISPPTFEPEFIDAYEIGAKNTLAGGALVLNLGAFYYDYKDYQVSKIVDRSAINENFDAKVWGLEAEWVFSPTRNLRFNGTFGHLNTEIAKGEQSIDLMDRTQGDPGWIVIKPSVTGTSNCLAPADLVAQRITYTPNGDLTIFCAAGNLVGYDTRAPSSPGASPEPYYVQGVNAGAIDRYFDPTTDAPNAGAGFFADLGGNDLPNAPHWTASFGAQYSFALPGHWDGTLRADFYRQSQSFARVYNTDYDKLRAWTNTNVSLWAENADWGLTAEVYVKNAFDETPITDAFLFSDDTGLVTNVFTLDPRLVGVSVRKTF